MAEEFTTPDVEAPSSSATETASPPPAAPDDNAPSSSADRDAPSSGDSRQSDREGLLAAVKSVVETQSDDAVLPSDDAETEPQDQVPPDQAAATDTGDQSPPDVQAPEPELPDPTEAELKKLRPETRRRFERLLAQRNEARQAYESLMPTVRQHQELQGYLQQHQLASDDVNVLLGVGAALRRGDYQAFLNGVTPYVLAAQEAIGLRISPDLQNQVEQGLIDEQSARELTRTRHRAAQAEARLQEVNQVATVENQVRHQAAIRTAVDNWEQTIQRQDPDYVRIAGAVRRYAQGLLQERGMPRDPNEGVALVKAAYDEVKGTFASVRPAPRPTRATPSSIHVATGTARAEPRNLKEVALGVLADMRRAS